MKPPFTGPLIDDIATWGGAGTALGTAAGFWTAMFQWARKGGKLNGSELGLLTAVGAGSLTSLGLGVAFAGHVYTYFLAG